MADQPVKPTAASRDENEFPHGSPGSACPIVTSTSGDQLLSIVTWKLSSWCSISSIVVSNRPMRTMPFQ
jgi:hypothetical protein